jgi:hypothetical protein
MIYLVVFLIIGVLLVSKTYKYLEKIFYKLKEFGITE